MDQEEYVRAARAVRDTNRPSASIGPRASLFMALPIGGGRRILKSVAEIVRRTETELRALSPPPADQSALEQHFLRPWSELAEYLEALAVAPRTLWLSPKGAFRLLERSPQDRQEDVDFCFAYGLDDSAEPGPGPSIEQPPAHGDSGKA